MRAFADAGFAVIGAEDHVGVSETDARQAPLSKRFAGREIADFTCTSSRFVLSPQ
jgi:hypothetical protein